MEVIYSPRFARDYKKLPTGIKDIAEKKENIFRNNPFDTRLKTHKLTGQLDGYWALSVTHSYRIIFDFVGEDTVRFYRVGPHTVYDV